jgi:hypothetical protein
MCAAGSGSRCALGHAKPVQRKHTHRVEQHHVDPIEQPEWRAEIGAHQVDGQLIGLKCATSGSHGVGIDVLRTERKGSAGRGSIQRLCRGHVRAPLRKITKERYEGNTRTVAM